MSSFKKFIIELHRRSLWQVLLIYVGGAWACYEIIDTVTDRIALPAWLPVLAIILFLLGLPFVVATAFVREGAGAEAAPGEPAAGAAAAEALATRRQMAARRRPLTWRNLGFTFVAVLAAWGAVAAGWLLLGGRAEGGEGEPVAAAISATRVAVLPFSVKGSDDIAYLGEGMVDLLSTALDGAGELRVVDPYALMKFLASERQAPYDPESGEAVAKRFGAGRFVLGSIVEAGGRVRVSASLYDADGRLEISAEEIAEDEGQVFGLVNNMARQLLAAGMGGPDVRLARVAAATTDSLVALKDYLAGESDLRAGRFSNAAAAFKRAVEVDSSFALAWHRLTIAAIFAQTPIGVRITDTAARAVRHSGRLSPRDRDRLAVLDAFLNGDVVEGQRLAREILRSYPEDMEAWWFLGEFLFHFGPFQGRPAWEAGDAFRRALGYDPDHYAALMHLSWTTSIEGRDAELEGVLKRLVELERGGEVAGFSRPVLAFLNGGRAALDPLLPGLRKESRFVVQYTSYRLALLDDGLPAAIEVAGFFSDPAWPPRQQVSGYARQASLELARGRWKAADQALGRLQALGEVVELETAPELRAALWVSPFLPARIEDLRRLQEALAGLNYDTVWAPLARDYLQGLVSVRLGGHDEALRHAGELESQAERLEAAGSSMQAALARYFAVSVRAQSAAAEGKAGEALGLLESVRPVEWWWRVVPEPVLLTQAHDRFLRAGLLEELGRPEEALDWYDSFGRGGDVFYLGPGQLRSAEIYERLGEREKAVLYYKRFIDRWRDCDPDLRPILAGAEQALVRLTGESLAP